MGPHQVSPVTKVSRHAVLLGIALVLGCGSSEGGATRGSGGSQSGSGGVPGLGGATVSDAAPDSLTGTDGGIGAGGSTGPSGSIGTGGVTPLGGATAASGGRVGAGGTRAGTGGVPGLGGRTGTGGSPTETGGVTGRGGTGGGVSMGGRAAGGAIGTGGATGTVTQVTRPSYNTGTGFFVLDGKLYDSKGVEFRIRGVNRNHYDMAAPGLPKIHANTVRAVLFFNGEWNSTTARNLQVMQDDMIKNHIVPMPGNWEGTCEDSPTFLTTIVDRWVAQATSYTPLDPYMILNIANEWGPEDSTVWRDSYITAIGRLRAAGYTCTISVTSGGCGQDSDDLVKYAQAVFDSDPQKNVIFDQHIYGNWGYDAKKQSWQQGLTAGLDALSTLGLPVIIGEFGPGRNIGPSPTDITPQDIIQAAEARNLGWMAWAWDDNPSAGDDGFALSRNGDYRSSADLTTFGKAVVEGPGYGLLAIAKYQTAF